MIAVRENKDGTLERIVGNPVLISLDGETKAPLAVILHESWTARDRAKFGVYLAEPFVVPEDKVAVDQPRYERKGDTVVEIRDLQDAPKPQPNPLDEIKAELAALAARVAAIEGR